MSHVTPFAAPTVATARCIYGGEKITQSQQFFIIQDQWTMFAKEKVFDHGGGSIFSTSFASGLEPFHRISVVFYYV